MKLHTFLLFCLPAMLLAQAPTASFGEHGKPVLMGNIPEQKLEMQLKPENFNEKNFSMEAWIVPGPRAKGYHTIVFKGDRSRDAAEISLQLFENVPLFSFINPFSRFWEGVLRYSDKLRTGKYGTKLIPLKDCAKVTPEQWNHIAGTFENGEFRTYVNGKPAARSIARGKFIPWTDASVRIGAGEGGGGGTIAFFDGWIGRISFYNRTLFPEEVSAHFEAERKYYPSGTIQVPDRWKETLAPQTPGFKTKLQLTQKYEKNLPPVQSVKNLPVKVVMHNGAPAFSRDGQILPGMMSCVSAKDKDSDARASERDFAAAGIRLTGVCVQNLTIWKNGIRDWYTGPDQYDWTIVDQQLEAAVKASPENFLLIRLKIDMPRWWCAQHKKEAGCTPEGKTDRFQPSFNSPSWRKDAMKAMQTFIRHVESGPWAGRVAGYLIAGGRASEWYWWGSHNGYVDYSECNQAAFRQWLGKRYKSDAALQRAYGNTEITLQTAAVPPPEERRRSEYGFFRYYPKARRVIDYRMFASDTVADCIGMFARGAKEAMSVKKPVGVFFGYTLWHPDLENQGFHSLGRVLRDPNVDFMMGCMAYDRRRAGQEGDYLNGYTASLTLHGKLYFDEADMRTCFTSFDTVYRTPTLEETLQVNTRTLANALTRGTSIQWLLLEGVRTFHNEELMRQIAELARIEKEQRNQPRRSTAEVALIMDEVSMMFVNDSVKQHRDYVRNAVSECWRAGVPFDTYLYSDFLEGKIPEYKLYVFPNLWYLGGNEREQVKKIHSILAKNKAAALWFYAPGFITYGGVSTGISQLLTGIKLETVRKVPRSRLKITAPDDPLARYLRQDPEYYAFDPGFKPVGNGFKTIAEFQGNPAVVSAEAPWGGRSIYSLTRPTAGLLRGAAEQAGVHIYNRTGDIVGANEGFIMLHAASDGEHCLELPRAMNLTDLLSGKTLQNVRRIERNMKTGDTMLFRIEK